MKRRASTRISETREEEYEMRERMKKRRRERIEEKRRKLSSVEKRETYFWQDKQNHLILATRKNDSLRLAVNAWIIFSCRSNYER